jgi:hypothetical protein
MVLRSLDAVGADFTQAALSAADAMMKRLAGA